MTTGRFTIFDRADELPPAWERLTRDGDFGLDPRLLRTLQSNVVDGSKRRYFLHEPESGPAVVAMAVLLEPSAARNPVASVLLGRFFGLLPASQDWLLPMLVLRAETTMDAPYCTDTRESGRQAALDGLLAGIEAYAEEHGWSIALDSVPADDAAMSAVCAGRGYLRTLARPTAELRIEWSSWEDYLKAASRHSKRAATNIRTELNRARREGLEIAEWRASETPEADLYRLVVEHERRLNGRASMFRPGLFSGLSQALGDDFKVFVARCGGRLQGVMAFARSGGRGYATYPGLLDEKERAASAYFNLMYYRPIQLAIELGLRSIAFGNAALEAKIRRGCSVQAGALCFRPRARTTRIALGPAVALHRRGLLRKYAGALRATPFSSLSARPDARPDH